jgi:excisionase family DNA binding protein
MIFVRGVGVWLVLGATAMTHAKELKAAEPAEPPELLTSAEVVALFGVDRRTVVLWAKRGHLPAVLTPGGQHRFRAVQIRRLLQQAENDR